ncbi:MAG TPA: class I SAM-dependent methyltransferase [Planctomycetota bacterium]|nr:class I SAM-dependent methyltransferase [Planctomycetota bacterium]
MSGPDDAGDWFRVAFGPHYRAVYASRDDASADRETAFAFDALKLTSGARLLDAGCGDGRHLAAWGRRGVVACGVDLSPELLAVARARGLRRLCRADVRALPFVDGAFDAVTSFFTSFGYFDDAGDRRHFAELARMLRRGGRLALDLPDRARLEATLEPETVRDLPEHRMRARRRLEGDRVVKVVELTPRRGGPPTTYRESVRLYRPAEVEALAAERGLRIAAVYGGFDGRAFGAGDRAIYVAEAA